MQKNRQICTDIRSTCNNDRYVDMQLWRSCSLNLLTLKITLTAQPVLLYMCTQQYHSDHCLPAKASSDICCHSVVSQSLSFSATVSKAFSEPQTGPAQNTVFHLDGKWTNMPTLTSDQLFIQWTEGHFDTFQPLRHCYQIPTYIYYLFMEVSQVFWCTVFYLISFINCHLKTKTHYSEHFLNIFLNIYQELIGMQITACVAKMILYKCF